MGMYTCNKVDATAEARAPRTEIRISPVQRADRRRHTDPSSMAMLLASSTLSFTPPGVPPMSQSRPAISFRSAVEQPAFHAVPLATTFAMMPSAAHADFLGDLVDTAITGVFGLVVLGLFAYIAKFAAEAAGEYVVK